MKPLGRCKRKRKNIKTDIKGIGYVAVSRIYLSQRRVKRAFANTVIKLQIPRKAETNFLAFKKSSNHFYLSILLAEPGGPVTRLYACA
jgi:hypothetical protein